jgi:uncharacterized lipoprotein YmbA
VKRAPFSRTGLAFGLSLFAASLSGCSGTEPLRYTDLAAAPYLQPNTGEDSARTPYRTAQRVDWRGYDKAILDPVVIYRGEDQQFGDMNDADRAELAGYLLQRFHHALAKRFTMIAGSGSAARASADPGTLRMRITLTGAETNTPVIAPLSRFDIGGALYNGVQAARGGEGVLTGSVSYAVEIFDAPTGRLLDAFVTKQYPGAYNIGATMGALAASKVGIDKGAEALAAQFQ